MYVCMCNRCFVNRYHVCVYVYTGGLTLAGRLKAVGAAAGAKVIEKYYRPLVALGYAASGAWRAEGRASHALPSRLPYGVA